MFESITFIIITNLRHSLKVSDNSKIETLILIENNQKRK